MFTNLLLKTDFSVCSKDFLLNCDQSKRHFLTIELKKEMNWLVKSKNDKANNLVLALFLNFSYFHFRHFAKQDQMI